MSTSHRGHSDEIAGSQMLTEMVRLRGALQVAALPLDLPGVAALREHRQEVIDQLEDYVIPRLMSMDAPLLTVVGGSTGAGKSTLVNTLVGHRVTTPGVLRPTTRSPVLVASPRRRHVVRPGPAVAGPEAGQPPHQRPRLHPARPHRRGPEGHRDPRRTGRRLGRGAQPDPRRAAARGRRPVAVRDVGGALQRPGPVGVPQAGRRALHVGGDRPGPHSARRGRDGRRATSPG